MELPPITNKLTGHPEHAIVLMIAQSIVDNIRPEVNRISWLYIYIQFAICESSQRSNLLSFSAYFSISHLYLYIYIYIPSTGSHDRGSYIGRLALGSHLAPRSQLHDPQTPRSASHGMRTARCPLVLDYNE